MTRPAYFLVILALLLAMAYAVWPTSYVVVSFDEPLAEPSHAQTSLKTPTIPPAIRLATPAAQRYQCRLPTQAFSLQWRHSVERQLWREDYRIVDHELHLVASYQQSFGAGSPYTGRAIDAPDGFVGLASVLSLTELNWVVSRTMQGQIITTKGRWPLYQRLADYTEVQINAARSARFILWLGTSCYDNDDFIPNNPQQ